MTSPYDYVIVGAGLTGATFAQQAKERGKRCLVIDQREHVAGNCYTEEIEGVNVHKFGPHVFHTSNKEVWDYMNRFTKFNHFVCRPKVAFRNNTYSFPINLMTLNQLWGVATPGAAKARLEEETLEFRKKYPNPSNMEEWALTQVGQELYETFVYGYTTKQWKRTPDKLPASILKRIPIRLTWDDNYFDDCYQGIPIGGYTQIFHNMLEGIETELGVDFFKERARFERLGKQIVYTGPVDKLFNQKHGALEYRTLRFEHQTFNVEDFQGTATFNWTEKDIPWTRTVEHSHFEFKKVSKTIVTREFPEEWTGNEVPYYPINDTVNNTINQRYQDMAKADEKYIVAGRLGRYKYYDMHQSVAAALSLADKHFR